ncbi:hypothetical protein [Shewanella xiamenensis]|uniref:hypothetical protein n=1 Tax=Shewanella xiamenensis TaxID=332186 RepID=UPI00217D2837|nr:hypothetical protein [Shewanella xiamenensis]MCT8874171.1 hypothetical protein [Shewanella xiamenensis]UWH42842.1 hypothetical protein KXJ80_06170 [Shewanella xiamenensis]
MSATHVSALADYCDKQIAETQKLIADYQHERAALERVIKGWRAAKRRHLALINNIQPKDPV